MKKVKALGLIAVTAVMLTGCIDSMPELTDEQSEIISEYSAGLLLKYSPNYDYKIVDEEVLAEAMAQEAAMEEASSETATEEQMQESSTEQEESGTQESTENTEEEKPAENESGVEIVATDETDLAELLGIEDVAVKYQSFELRGSYPEESDGFSLTAAQGKTLLIVHFDIESATGSDAECDFFDYNLNIRMNVNDKSVKALSTLLPNDIASYMETISAGELKDVVAVAEIDDITDEEIESLSLSISSASGSFNVQLR